jgi:hypothetical protein
MLRRILQYQQNGERSEVIIEFGCPKPRDDDFGCRLRIKGESFNVDRIIYGVDSLQAITLAIKLARSIITDSEAYKEGRLYWLEPGVDFDLL